MDDERLDRLYDRACAILDGRPTGHGRPILEAPNRRGHAPARSMLAAFLTTSASPRDRARGRALTLRSALLGDATGPYNLAIEHLNAGRMQAYRRWLRVAARSDPDARTESRAFRLRYPHAAMRRWHRLSPA